MLLGKDIYEVQRKAGINFLGVFSASYNSSDAPDNDKVLKQAIVEELLVEHKDIFGDTEKSKEEMEVNW